MRSKAPLVLMEQMVMLLVFALAAALCLQTFVLSEKLSKHYEMKDRAALEAQNVAELLKKGNFDLIVKEMHFIQSDNNVYKVYFDTEWEIIRKKEEMAYYLEVSYLSSYSDYFWEAEITVYNANGVEVFKLSTAGQKVMGVAEKDA